MRLLSGNARFGIIKNIASERKSRNLIIEFAGSVEVGPPHCRLAIFTADGQTDLVPADLVSPSQPLLLAKHALRLRRD